MTKLSEHRSWLQKAASVLLIVLMVLGTVGMISSLFGDLKKAEAATAGKYKWRVRVVSENDTGGWNDEEFRVYGCKNNGTSSQTSSAIASKDDWKIDFKGERTNTFGLGDQTTSEFPTKITYYYSFGGGATWRELRFYMYLEVYNNNTSSWENIPLSMTSSGVSNTLNLGANGGSGGNYEQRIQAKSSAFSAAKGTITYTVNAKKPYAAEVSAITGGSASVNVPTDGTSTNYTNNFTVGTVKDQYGVNWYQDPTLSVSRHTGVSLSGNKVAVNSNGNAASDYTVTVTQTCGSATSSTTVSVLTFDYIVVFKNYDGTTLKTQNNIDYGGSATAPAHPNNKPADATYHYEPDGWDGTYTNLTTGAQTKTVTAKYKGTVHDDFLVWQAIDDNNHKQVCSVCGYVKVASQAHTFGNWIVDTAATCETTGTRHHVCSICNRSVSEAIPATGHNYGTPSYVWAADNSSVTATVVCGNDSSHVITETKATTATTTQATCEAAGKTVYTVSFTDSHFTAQSKEVAIPATGHAWGTPTYTWAANNSSVTATVVCGNDSSHQITETVNTVASTTPATCVAAGSTVYTATFENELFAPQTNTVVIEKLGHDWGAWTSISEEQHQRTCGNDANHTETENHNYGAWVNQNDGTKTRECTVCHHTQTMHVSYSVQFNGNGATGGSMNPQSFTCGTPQSLTANAFTRSYTVTYVYNNGDADGSATAAAAFDGWATAADGAKVYNDGQNVNNLTTIENGVVDLYAVWTLGSVTLPTPSNAGYVFGGWYADSTLETAVSGSSFTPTANTTLYAKWTQIAVDDQFILQNGLPATLDVLGNDISGAAIDSVSGGTGFTTAISNGKILFTPSAALTGTVSFTYTASYGGRTATATVKVVPATNVYYEESGLITFTDGTASWQDAGAEYSNVFQEGQRPGESGSPMAAYETTNETTYSLGKAKYVTVTKGDSGATASFTFSGTGFDLYAATTNKAGAALVRVVSADGSYNKLTMVNAYFGYEYGQLYLKDGKVTLDSSGDPIYYTSDTGNDTFFVNGTRRGTTTPTSEGYAYGWVASSASSEDGIYQAPVISFMDLDYGTYTVTVTPQYSARQDLTGDGEYKFYVDAVRIYNPINPQALDSDAQAAYAQAKELGATYKEVRDLLIKAETFYDATGSNEAAGVAFLELSDTTKTALQNYEDIGPKNEVYLAPGQAIAFNMTTATNVAPAKLEIGLKMARGSSGSVRIDSAKTQTVNITGATDLYRDITDTVQWAQTDASTYKTTGPIIITNTSDAGCVISITKVKWSYDQAVPANGRAMQFSFAAQDLVTAKAVAKAIHVAQTTADASGVVLKWNRASYSIGDAATLTITAPASFRQAYIDGAALTGYTETEEGLRQWTYTFVAQKSGTFSYDVTLEDGAARRTEPLTASVTVAGGQNAPGGNNGKRMLTLQQLLQTLAAKLMQIFKLSFMKGTVK